MHKQQSSSVFLFFSVPRVSLLAQVGRLSLQAAPSLSTVAAVAPGQRPLDTTTVSLNNVFLCRLLHPPCSSPPSSQYEFEDLFPSPPLLPSCCVRATFVVAKLLWLLLFDDLHVRIVFLLLSSVALLDCSSTLCPSRRTGKEQGEVNQRKLPICSLVRLRSVYSCVC